MSRPLLYIIVIILAITALGFTLGTKYKGIFQKSNGVACTQDAKLCPDGSYVGRTGPNCEFAACPQEEEKGQGTVSGKVTIGPLCPVEPCPGDVTNPYVSREVILQLANGYSISIKLDEDGNIPKTQVSAGKYSATLTNCEFLGCRQLPKTVTVTENQNTQILIDIDTGIR